MKKLETPNNNGDPKNVTNVKALPPEGHTIFHDDIDSCCSTPYVSAPSSPGRGSGGGGGGGFFYSAPASPMHFILSSSSLNSVPASSDTSAPSNSSSFEFDFSSRCGNVNNGSGSAGSMSSADELFLNGKIRPMKLSSHLKRPQVLAPLLDLDEQNGVDFEDVLDEDTKLVRGRDLRLRDRSLRRRTRSLSPFKTSSFEWHEDEDDEVRQANQPNESTRNDLCFGNDDASKQNDVASGETTPSASSSRSSSVGRSSKRWVFLKEFLYRSKSEGQGRNNGHKFWSLSFSPVKDKKMPAEEKVPAPEPPSAPAKGASRSKKTAGKATNGVGKRRVPLSPHELHYTANRAQAEEMRKKTFLPYRQGLLGCLGFSSKSYGAMNGLARTLNPVSSR
ncbi:hypothetical protein RJ640_013735 [Escallonia rubra]|uniref:Calmodulin binding protein n=1 Tax=Escallonia rubra TaxID=112253 RepID=A0AA88UJM0_9ASTE|nr:hypothetical protein RJ640_013735 [Escallonia rubra]